MILIITYTLCIHISESSFFKYFFVVYFCIFLNFNKLKFVRENNYLGTFCKQNVYILIIDINLH
jgi:hypothetical protein